MTSPWRSAALAGVTGMALAGCASVHAPTPAQQSRAIPSTQLAASRPLTEPWTLPFVVTAGRPMLEATVGGVGGRVMFDTGTEDVMLLNRALAPLDAGQALGTGQASSGQRVEVRRHPAPEVTLGGRPLPLGPVVRSGDFGFLLQGLRPDFLGFVGVGWVQERAFVLDYGRRALTLLPLKPDRTLAVPAPSPAETLARIDLRLVQDELPLAAGAVGERAMLIDFDTGDTSTFYLKASTVEALAAAGRLTTGPGGLLRLDDLHLGGARFDAVNGRWVEVGGPDDHRRDGQPELLRLGSSFLQQNPTLWNLAGGTILVLRPDAPWLAQP